MNVRVLISFRFVDMYSWNLQKWPVGKAHDQSTCAADTVSMSICTSVSPKFYLTGVGWQEEWPDFLKHVKSLLFEDRILAF